MAILIPPGKDTKVIRREHSPHSPPGLWHFQKSPEQERVTRCDILISGYDKLQVTRLERIKAGELCPVCWGFEKTDQESDT